MASDADSSSASVSRPSSSSSIRCLGWKLSWLAVVLAGKDCAARRRSSGLSRGHMDRSVD
eukprot:71111-Pyramimonas_sp.AAC.1